MSPAEYDSWYDTAQGGWVGETELNLILRELGMPSDGSLLDIGCGTGWFTRRLASRTGLDVTGVDINSESLAFARTRDQKTNYLLADAQKLPFADASFDYCFSVAALCFATDWQKAIAECVRVSRKSFAVGLLNRHSLHWLNKGQNGGIGSYRGAAWLSSRELRGSLSGLEVKNVRLSSCVFIPSGSGYARFIEKILPSFLPLGALLVLAGQPVHAPSVHS